MSFQEVDVAVLGGGAAGLMAALTAGQRGRRVALLEGQERVGKKILISGGGRCNFTNLGAAAENYLSAQPDFCKSALARYTPYHFIELVEKHGIAYHEKKLGQQFCDGSSKQIVAMLETECAEAGVAIHLDCRVGKIEALSSGGFQIETSAGSWKAGALIVATGGLSFPKLGASDFGYALARQFGLRVIEPRPGLVPLTWKQDGFAPALSGTSMPVTVRCGRASFEESMLFTHVGLSGPAILQISSYWKSGEPLRIDLSAEPMPKRLARQWAERYPSGRLDAWEVFPEGTEGYAKAEVTLGGVATEGLSSKTMEARAVPGLFFIGEVVDVTGHLGGYNFQWAWASGHAAGLAV